MTDGENPDEEARDLPLPRDIDGDVAHESGSEAGDRLDEVDRVAWRDLEHAASELADTWNDSLVEPDLFGGPDMEIQCDPDSSAPEQVDGNSDPAVEHKPTVEQLAAFDGMINQAILSAQLNDGLTLPWEEGIFKTIFQDEPLQALLISMKGSGDAELDEGVYMATMKELDKGFLRGPVAPESLPPGATLTRRFGVVQGGKVRPIDDYKASLVNASVTQPEMVCLHSVDHIAGLGAQLIRAHAMRGKNVLLLAKCWDLASAYKQVPLSEDAFKYDSFLVVFNPRTGKGEIFQQLVLPFGSIASVTAFLRCALAIWHIGSSLLHYTWTSYFDDFLSLTEESLGPHLEMCVSLFFQLLGWGLSLDKLVPYSTCCKVLGVELDLTKTPSGTFAIANTVSRKDELKDTLQHVLSEGFLGRSEAERLRGRLQFASNQLFGRRFRNCLRELNKHINRGMKTLSADLRSALTALKCLIDANVPRGYSGIGGQLYDMYGECLGFFSEKVSDSLLESIKRPDQITVIFELEGLAIAAGMQVFSQIITGKRVIVFTDNQAVQSCIVKCKSANDHMDSMIRRICSLEESMGLLAWLERVPSQSNPADELSRSEMESWHELKRARIDLLKVWEQCKAEPIDTSLHSGEWREDVS
eukprot:s402_g17.t1